LIKNIFQSIGIVLILLLVIALALATLYMGYLIGVAVFLVVLVGIITYLKNLANDPPSET
jgi:hypothetical protein